MALALAAMVVSVGVGAGARTLEARYILIRAATAPMPLFDGVIQFLGYETRVECESLTP